MLVPATVPGLVHEAPPFVEYSHLTTVPLCPVTLTLPEFEPLHTVDTVTADAVPAIDVASTVIFLVNEIAPDVHDVVVLVINVNVTGILPGVFNVCVLNVNVPDPVPVADEMVTPSIVPVKLQPCPVGTLETVTEYVVELPWHIGPPTLFNVTVGNTFTFTVIVELNVVGPHTGLVLLAV